MTDIFIALVAPLGINLEKEVLPLLIRQIHTIDPQAKIEHIRISDLFKEIYDHSLILDEHQKRKAKIAIGNYACEKINAGLKEHTQSEIYIDKGALSYLAIREIYNRKIPEASKDETTYWILNQLKRPAEIYSLRHIFRNSFFTLSFHVSKEERIHRLKEEFFDSNKESMAVDLINQDEREEHDYGQNLRDVFPMADFFLDCTDHKILESCIERFLRALYCDVYLLPSKHEFGMYLAEAESFRSLDLSRQVGASIINKHGSIVSLGCNEVPRANGGHYTDDDLSPQRDREKGYDSNQFYKEQISKELRGLLNEVVESQELTPQMKEQLKSSVKEIEKLIESEQMKRKIKGTRFQSLIEFGRAMHAEMCAICDAARNHRSTQNCILYSTLFPCHLCARFIVGAGIKEVFFIEPYAKSLTKELYSDSIVIDPSCDCSDKVVFRHFIGIAPRMYRKVFNYDHDNPLYNISQRKDKNGQCKEWEPNLERWLFDEKCYVDILNQITEDMEKVLNHELKKAASEYFTQRYPQ